MDETRADELTRRWTAWPSFQAMLEAKDDPTYFPTLCGPEGKSMGAIQERAEIEELADLYDQAQASRGDMRKAYRGARDFMAGQVAVAALHAGQAQAVRDGLDKLTTEDIESEIHLARQERRRG